MQNFSFNVKQPATIKPVEDASKNVVNPNKLNQNPANAQDNAAAQNSFQSLLNKQVQAKRAQENLTSTKPNSKPVAKSVENAQAKNTTSKNTTAEVTNAPTNNAVVTEKKPSDESVKVAQDSLLNQLNIQPTDKMPDVETLEKEDNKRKMTEDAAILAAVMQDVNNPTPQLIVDPAALKINVQGTVKTDATLKKSADDASASLEMHVKDGLIKDIPAGLDVAKESQPLENTLPAHEVVSKEQQIWKDVFSSKMQPLEAKAEQAEINPLNALKAPSFDAEALKTLTNKEGLFKDLISKGSANKDLTTINPAQNFQQVNSTLNNAGITASQLGSSQQITVPFGKSGWDQAISQKVMWMVGAGEQSATLTLNPPDLGPLQVVISVNNDQADTTFISDNADVRQALQDGLGHLREKMEASGIQLGQANINAGQQSQQNFQETGQKSFSGQAKTQSFNNASEPLAPVIRRETNGLVDTFA